MDLKLKDYIFKVESPCVFKKILITDENHNSVNMWTPSYLAKLFSSEKFTFRIGKKSLEENRKYDSCIKCGV